SKQGRGGEESKRTEGRCVRRDSEGGQHRERYDDACDYHPQGRAAQLVSGIRNLDPRLRRCCQFFVVWKLGPLIRARIELVQTVPRNRMRGRTLTDEGGPSSPTSTLRAE